MDEHAPGGVRGVGTVNHCVHGGAVINEEVLDWKPFRYLTDRSQGPFGVVLFTIELTAVGERTHVSVRMLPEGGPEALERARAALPDLQRWYAVAADALDRLVAGAHASAEERSPSLQP